MVPLAQGRKASGRLKSGKLVIFPDCGHVPHIEKPARFAEVLGDFLEERLFGEKQTSLTF